MMRVTLDRLKRPASIVIVVLLVVHFLMLVLLLLMGVSMGTPPLPNVVAQDGHRIVDYSEIKAQLLKTSPCQGVSPGNMSAWQPVFIVVITANPSTTEVHSFAFLRCCLDNKFILQKEDSYTDHRSIASFANKNKKLRLLLNPLLARATNFVPTRFRTSSPIVFRATSTLRNLVSRRASNRLIFRVKSLLRASSFRFRPDQVTIVQKSDEAADLWLSAAFLTGRFYAQVSSPLAVSHLAGGTLWVAVPVSRNLYPVVEKHIFRNGDQNSGDSHPYDNAEQTTKRSRRDEKTSLNDLVWKKQFHFLGIRPEHSKSYQTRIRNPTDLSVYRSLSFKKKKRKILPLSGRKGSSVNRPQLISSHITVAPSPTLWEEMYEYEKYKKTQYRNEEIYTEYLNKSLDIYPKTFASGLNGKRRIQNGFFAPIWNYTKKESPLQDEFKNGETLNLNSDKNSKLWKRLNSKFFSKKKHAKKKKPKRLDVKKLKSYQQFPIERHFRRQKNTKTHFPLHFKLIEPITSRKADDNIKPFISIWCKYNKSSIAAYQTKKYSLFQRNNLHKYPLNNLTSGQKNVLESYCRSIWRTDFYKHAEDRPFLNRNNTSHMHVKNGPKEPDSRYQKSHRSSSQIQEENIHRKFGQKRSQSRLELPDNVVAENNGDNKEWKGGEKDTKRRRRRRKLKGKRRERNDRGKRKNRLKHINRINEKREHGKKDRKKEEITEFGEKYYVLAKEHLKIRGCNEKERRKKRQSYCPTGVFPTKEKPDTTGNKMKKGDKETTFKKTNGRKRGNKNHHNLYYKRRGRRKNKSGTGSTGSIQTQIPEKRSSRYSSGRIWRKREKRKTPDKFNVEGKSLFSLVPPSNRLRATRPRPLKWTGDGLIGLAMTRRNGNKFLLSPFWEEEKNIRKEPTSSNKKEKRIKNETVDYQMSPSSKILKYTTIKSMEKPFVKLASMSTMRTIREGGSGTPKRNRRWTGKEKTEGKTEKENKMKNENKYLRLSANVTFRCSPSKKFWLFATSFPLGIYPARVSILLEGKNSSSDGYPSRTASVARSELPTPRPSRHRSDIPPEEAYNLSPKKTHLNSSASPPPRQSLTPLPEPRGPGPPNYFLIKSPLASSVLSELPKTSIPPFQGMENTSSDRSENKSSVNNGTSILNQKALSRNSVGVEDFLRNKSLKTVWTDDTLRKVKNVVDSVLRAIGSTSTTEKVSKEEALEKKHDDNSANNETSFVKEVSSNVERIRKVKPDFKSRKRKLRRRKPQIKLGNRTISNSIATNKESQRTVVSTWHQRALPQSVSNKSIFNHSHVNVKHVPMTESLNDSKPAVLKAKAISSVTDLLFTVPNLSIIKPVENSKVDSAIKSTEKLVRTSLTDLLYHVPPRSDQNNTGDFNISNDSYSIKRNDLATSTVEDKEFFVKGSEMPENELNGAEASDEMILKSSCIPMGSKGRFIINDVIYRVVGKQLLTNRTRECWAEVTKIVEKYISVPTLVEMDFLATAAFYFVAATANLMDPSDSIGYVRPSEFRAAANEEKLYRLTQVFKRFHFLLETVCNRPQEMLPDPLVCLDYQFVAALLLRGFNLPPEKPVIVCDYLGGFQLGSALGTAINYLQGH